MAFERMDDFALTLLATAPIARCACPRRPAEDCNALRCAACRLALHAVAAWGNANAFDGNGQRISQQYIRRALTLDVGRWNLVRRGLMVPLPAAAPPMAAPPVAAPPRAIHVRVEVDVVVCAICLEAVPDHDARHLPCRHVFHWDCVRMWLRRQRTCPICRRGL